jgi:hypothetical protein
MRKLILLLPVLVIIVYGCKKERTGNVDSLSNFPLATGDVWTYQVDDSINHTTQTATFKITASTVFGGMLTFNTQTIINGVVVDSGLIVNSGDTVMYQPNGQSLFSNLTLLFPLSANSKWHTEYYGDSAFVIAANINLSVAGNNYDSVCNVGRIQSVPDLYIHQNLYIAPHVGIIQETLDVAPWIPVHKTIKLISYNLH